MSQPSSTRRKVYVVLSARSLPYAGCCLASLLRNVAEPIDLTLITDGPDDKVALEAALATMPCPPQHSYQVFDKADADHRAASYYAEYPAVAAFRDGHPCWRKITDPPLFAAPGEEVVLLDPDVYFPNPFTFEVTPESGILLMWQRPNCLLPEDIVQRAYDQGIPMSDHTDIGVSHFRALDLPFLDSLITRLGGTSLPRSMHVESIIWAAVAERFGGGYLDPKAWRCFDNSVASRISRRFGTTGNAVLQGLDFENMKAFHAGGVAKNWLPDAEKAGLFAAKATVLDAPTRTNAFTLYPRAKFDRKLKVRGIARSLGLYRLLAQ